MDIAGVFQGFAGLLWLVTVGLVVLAVMRATRGRPLKGATTIILIVAVAALLVTSLSAGLVTIDPPERGIVISYLSPKGYRDQILQPGLRWIIPYFEHVVRYPISTQIYTMSIAPTEGQVTGDDSVAARTLDGQEIFVDASVIYAVDPEKVINVHIAWQDRYTNELVRPQARGIVRDAVSQFRVEEVVSTKRFEMVKQVRDTMASKLEDNGLILVDFVLRNITFSPEYAASVEQKQIADQQAQQAKFVVEQRKQEAEQARQSAQGQADAVVIRAKGDADARLLQAKAEAEALRMIEAALQNNPDLLTYQYITKLSPNIEVMLVPNNTPYLLPLQAIGPSTPTDLTVLPTPEPTPLPTPTTTP
jgi:regulator of protease activity HflC (stomatin/prohibitin superfamily)